MSTIVAIERVRTAVERALSFPGTSQEEAIAVAAMSLGLPEEAVREVVAQSEDQAA
jgi:hypothetical protein